MLNRKSMSKKLKKKKIFYFIRVKNLDKFKELILKIKKFKAFKDLNFK
jgi:hypothetical protein